MNLPFRPIALIRLLAERRAPSAGESRAQLLGDRCARAGWLLVTVMALAAATATPALAASFGFADVDALARAAAARAYEGPVPAAPADLRALGYDAYRDIRHRPERALWRNEGLPFELVPLHLGGGNVDRVALHEVGPDGARRLAFAAADYDYGANAIDPSGWGDIGHAGFRVHFALNTTTYKDELVVFLGASYFRALGRGQQYGLSARGLGIDTGAATAEEFPRFKAFWIVKPLPGATQLVVYALLDSPRSSGAYQFTIEPGDSTVVDVRTSIYLRAGVQTLAIAPLTSMFRHGENQPDGRDFRPEVHDSDGLAVAATQRGQAVEWLWRPLVNPKRALVSAFAVDSLRGFGLMQRDRAFASYEDLEARYDRRPSAWVEPVGDWGPGRVELLQLPTPDETHDNVAAYWVPQQLPPTGQPLQLAWHIRWQGDSAQRPPHAWTVQSRRGAGWERAGTAGAEALQYVVDFAGPALAALPVGAVVEAAASSGVNGEVLAQQAYRNDATGGWRMVLRLRRIDPARPTEISAFLRSGPTRLTETWTSLIPAD